MESLNISFAILTGVGIWKPIITSSKLNENLYNLWRIIFTPLPYMLASAQLARIMFVDMDFDELTEILFIFISILNVCCKSMSFLVRRKELANLANMLNAGITKAHDVDEADIQDQYHQFIRYTTISSTILVEITAITFLLPPLFQPKNYRNLPFKIWLPYNYTTGNIFWLTYVTESIGIITVSLISVSSNTLIFGFLIEACHQFELLSHRFSVLPKFLQSTMKNEKMMYDIDKLERLLMIRNIRHHIFIFNFINAFRKTFSSAIIGQFIVSSVVISMSVYQLSSMKTIDVVLFTRILYLMCMLIEFFLYCWFGNELTLKSMKLSNSVFEMDWIALSENSNKDIIITIQRSSKPLIISSGFFVILSVDSFMKIIKLSYSAFSVLRQASS